MEEVTFTAAYDRIRKRVPDDKLPANDQKALLRRVFESSSDFRLDSGSAGRDRILCTDSCLRIKEEGTKLYKKAKFDQAIAKYTHFIEISNDCYQGEKVVANLLHQARL